MLSSLQGLYIRWVQAVQRTWGFHLSRHSDVAVIQCRNQRCGVGMSHDLGSDERAVQESLSVVIEMEGVA